MRILSILFKKELNTYFLSPFGWVVLAFVVFMQGLTLSATMKGFRDTPVKDSIIYVSFHHPLSATASKPRWDLLWLVFMGINDLLGADSTGLHQSPDCVP